ncbi:MAG TPA: (2Fe-2S) ferredoxin domain-containing protein [Candidatus Wallbacteria bacterium]|nr:(2Fe-2S) ferredoxin domain-containing protein [Candidatus Wallbacteria bacterium]
MVIDDKIKFKRHIIICTNVKEDPAAPCCGRSGESQALYKKLKEYIKSNNIKDTVKVTQARCFSMCAEGPNMVVYPEQIWHHHVEPGDFDEIIEKYIRPFEVK